MKKPTITVAVPAFNEAENIGNILNALMEQKYTKTQLKEIIVYTDGSTDGTVQLVKKKIQKIKKVRLIEGRTQKGKFYRLNKLFAQNDSDVLIVLDADIGIVGNTFVEDFARSLLKDKKAKIVSAHEIPLEPKNFLGRVIASSYTLWDYVRLSVPNYDHVQNLYARATAYRGSFTKNLCIPDEATEERLYLYLMAKKEGGYRYTKNATIVYWPVSTVYDYVKLSERAFGRPQPAVNKLFGYDATYLYSVPKKYQIQGIMKSFIHNPFYTPLGMLLGFVLSKSTLGRKTQDSAIWEVSLSSKRSIYI